MNFSGFGYMYRVLVGTFGYLVLTAVGLYLIASLASTVTGPITFRLEGSHAAIAWFITIVGCSFASAKTFR